MLKQVLMKWTRRSTVRVRQMKKLMTKVDNIRMLEASVVVEEEVEEVDEEDSVEEEVDTEVIEMMTMMESIEIDLGVVVEAVVAEAEVAAAVEDLAEVVVVDKATIIGREKGWYQFRNVSSIRKLK